MIVEYLSSITAAMLIIFLAPTGAFDFATDEVVERSAVLVLMAYQLSPELFLDLYVTFMEIQGGLKKVHAAAWDLSTGADPESPFRAHRWGDFAKALPLKIAVAVALLSFVLLATAN